MWLWNIYICIYDEMWNFFMEIKSEVLEKWCIHTHRHHIMVCKNPSNRSGISSNAPPQTLWRPYVQWRRPFKTPSSWPFSKGPQPESQHRESRSWQPIRRGWQSLTQLFPPGINGMHPLSSQDTWFQISR